MPARPRPGKRPSGLKPSGALRSPRPLRSGAGARGFLRVFARPGLPSPRPPCLRSGGRLASACRLSLLPFVARWRCAGGGGWLPAGGRRTGEQGGFRFPAGRRARVPGPPCHCSALRETASKVPLGAPPPWPGDGGRGNKVDSDSLRGDGGTRCFGFPSGCSSGPGAGPSRFPPIVPRQSRGFPARPWWKPEAWRPAPENAFGTSPLDLPGATEAGSGRARPGKEALT